MSEEAKSSQNDSKTKEALECLKGNTTSDFFSATSNEQSKLSVTNIKMFKCCILLINASFLALMTYFYSNTF